MDLDRVERSTGRDGIRIVVEEEHHVFRFEDRYNLAENRGSRTLSFGVLSGEPVSAVRAALEFLDHCRTPNVGRLSIRHTPPERGVIDPNLAFTWPDEMQHKVHSLTQAIEFLSIIQEHSSAPILVPDWTQVTTDHIAEWQFVATILNGHKAIRTYPEGHCLIIELPADTVIPDGTFAVTVPLSAQIGTEQVQLGRVEAWLTDAVMIEHYAQETRTLHALTTPERRVRFRLPDAT